MSNPNLNQNIKQDWIERDIVMPTDMNSIGSNINNLNKMMPIYSANGSFYEIQSIQNNVYNIKPITYNDDTNNVCPSTYFEGMEVCFRLSSNNPSNCKVNVNGLGAKDIKKYDGSFLKDSYISSGNYMNLRFDSLQNCFFLVSGLSYSSGTNINISDIGVISVSKPIPSTTPNVTSESADAITSGGVYTALLNKQDNLVSGTNIKTINNQNLLGQGNIEIESGSNLVELDVLDCPVITQEYGGEFSFGQDFSSDDGIWKGRSSVAYGNGKYICIDCVQKSVGSTTYLNFYVRYSNDGINWQLNSTRFAHIASSDTSMSICFGNNIFVCMVARKIYYSEDGINWTQSSSSADVNVSPPGIYYINNYFIYKTALSTQTLNYSLDGNNWNATSQSGYAYIVSNKKIFRYYTTTKTLEETTDFINWNNAIQTNFPVSSNPSYIYYFKNKYFAFFGAAIYSSEDLSNWVEAVTGSALLYPRASTEDILIAGIDGASKEIYFTNDGINWITKEIPYYRTEHLCYANDKFIYKTIPDRERTDGAYSLNGIDWGSVNKVTIPISSAYSIYNISLTGISGDVNISFDTENVDLSKIIKFEIKINTVEEQQIIYPTNIKWLSEPLLKMPSNSKSNYIFRTDNNANDWYATRVEVSGYGPIIIDSRTLSSATALGSYDIDLSDYLPNDEYNYEVIFSLSAYSTSSTYTTIQFSTDLTPTRRIANVGSYSRYVQDTFNLPVGTKRTVYYSITRNALTSDSYVSGLVALGYRRIGKNG